MKKIIHSIVDVYSKFGDSVRFVCSVRGGEVHEYTDMGHYFALDTAVSSFDASEHAELFTELVGTFDLGRYNQNEWAEIGEVHTKQVLPDVLIEYHHYRWVNNFYNWEN